MPTIQMLNPENLGKPIAPYSNVARVKASEFLFIAGQVGTDKDGRTPADFEGPGILQKEIAGLRQVERLPRVVHFADVQGRIGKIGIVRQRAGQWRNRR